MSLKAIIFDMDGVVIDSEKLYDITLDTFFTKRWIPYIRESMKPMYMGKSAKEASTLQKELYNLPESIDELTAEKRATLSDLIEKELEFIPGFLEYFSFIKSKWLQYSIATGTGDVMFIKKDAKLGIKKLFDNNIVTVDQVWWIGKPDPTLFLTAAKMIWCTPDECLVIEDALFGIQAAHRAHIPVIWFTSTLSESQIASENPTYIAHSYDEIRKITEELL